MVSLFGLKALLFVNGSEITSRGFNNFMKRLLFDQIVNIHFSKN